MKETKIVLRGTALILLTKDSKEGVTRKTLVDIRDVLGWKALQKAIRLTAWDSNQVDSAVAVLQRHRRASSVASKTTAVCIGCNWTGPIGNFNKHIAQEMDRAARRALL